MKTLKTTPGAKRLVESLRNMGYDCSTAIADLIDNSITADASEIHIEILSKQGSRPAAIYVADNGKGMDKEDLQEAMRFGTLQEYSSDDLGRYGLGLKTASLSQCRALTVSSKPKPRRDAQSRRHCMRWDIDHIYEVNDWDLLILSDDELEPWERDILEKSISGKSGNVVLWTKLDESLSLLSDDDPRKCEKFMAQLITEVSAHIRMVFHRFMQGSIIGRRKLDIYICGERLIPWDPFCRDESTRELDIVKMPVVSTDVDGSRLTGRVTVSPFILPRADEFSSTVAWRDASGPKNWNQQQGFYFYRNNRLLQAGGWSYLRAPDEHTKLLRVAIDFTSDLDRAFSINITKMRALIPADIREKLINHVSDWAKIAGVRYRKTAKRREHASKEVISVNKKDQRPSPDNVANINLGQLIFSPNDTSGGGLIVATNKKTGQIEILVPRSHDLSQIFTLGDGGGAEIKKLCLAMLSILEAVYEKKIRIERIPIAALKKIYKRNL